MRSLPVLLLSLQLLPGAALAQADPRPRWEIGLIGGAASTQAYPGAGESTRRARVLPYLIYRGDRLRVDRGGVSVRALRTPSFELDVGTSGALGSSNVKAREGMPELGDLIELGPRLTWHLGQGGGGGRWQLQLPLRGVFDLSDSLAFSGITFEPELEFSRGGRSGWRTSASVSAIVGSERFNDLYYQVDPAFATPARPAYDARAGLVAWRLGASVSRWLGSDWRVFGFARVDHLAGSANRASPLVRRHSGGGIGIGLQWVFFRSAEAAPD
jgi:outer membrane protein